MKRIIAVFLAVIFLALPVSAANYAYVLKFSTNEADQVVRFDADKDEIVGRIIAPDESGWNNFLVDEKGGCFIASYRKNKFYGRDIYYYDPDMDQVKRFINLGEIFGPSDMALTKNELIVHVMGHSGDMGQSDGILFIDRKSRKIIKELYIPKGEYTQASVNGMYYDGEKYLVMASFYGAPRMNDMDKWRQIEYTGDLFVVDIHAKDIVKTIRVPREYKSLHGVFISGDRIYAVSTFKGIRDKYGNAPINNDVLVFSISSGQLIKTIKVDGFPFQLVHDRTKNRIYVFHRNENVSHSTIEVIDPRTDKVINALNIPNQLMASMVAPDKMYLTAGNAQFENRKIPSRLYVIDTRTDRVIKEFDGIYTGISINQKY